MKRSGIDRTPPEGQTSAGAWRDCIDRMYDAVGREQKLAEALGRFMPFFDARGVSFLTIPDMRHPTTSHTGSVGVNEQSLIEYHSHFSAHDEWVLAAQRRNDFGAGMVCSGSDLIPRSRLRRSYFWREFLTRYAVTDILTAMVESSSSSGPGSFLTFHRHEGQRPFGRRDVNALSRLAPHLRQVLRLHRRLARSTLAEVVERIEVPVLFLAGDGRVVESNAAASAEMRRAEGWLRNQAGRLSVSTAQGWVPLGDVLPGVHSRPEAQGRMAMDLVAPDRRCASLSLLPIQGAVSDRIAQHAAACVGVLSRGPRERAQALRDVHGLTAAEARVAMHLADGKAAAEIAAQQQLTLNTVRTHIASALGKLGLRRQAQLVAAVLAL